MNKRAPCIGIKMKISDCKEIELNRGNNIFYSSMLLHSIDEAMEDTASRGSIVFSINCINQQKAMLRTYKNFPMIIKQMEQNGSRLILSQRYMNDSLVYLNDLPNIKIMPLTENKVDSIVFEPFAIQTEVDDSSKKRKRKRSGIDMEFLDNVIKYYNQEKNKEGESVDDYKKNGEREEDIPIKGSEPIINVNANVKQASEIVIETNDYYNNSPPILSDNTKDEDMVIANQRTSDQNMNEYSLRKQLKDSAKKAIIENNINKEKTNNINNNVCLRRKRQRKPSFTIKKCPICLEEIKEKSQLDTCKHEFCKKCIDHWALVSSQCPCCKDNFKKIIYFNSLSRNTTEKKIKKKIFKPEEEDDEQWFSNCDEKCFICGKSDNTPLLLVCDNCNFRICHTFCVGLDSIPDEDFICPECTNKTQTHQHKNNRGRRKQKNMMSPSKPDHCHKSKEQPMIVKRSLRLRDKPKKKYSLRTKIKS